MALSFLKAKTDYALNDYYQEPRDVTVKNVGQMLCGVNWKLAEDPFSEDFLNNVAFNSSNSFYPILWLQLNYRQRH